MHPRCYRDWLEAQERSARRWRVAGHVAFVVASAAAIATLLWLGR